MNNFNAVSTLNLLTVSVSQILDYNNRHVLQREYDMITNNLNLQNIEKNDALRHVFKHCLETISKCRISEYDKMFVEREYQMQMKNAFWDSVPSMSVFFAGGTPLQMGLAAITQVGAGVMNYRSNKLRAELERDRQRWEIEGYFLEMFDGLRNELFDTAWKIAEEHKHEDILRLTPKQLKEYNDALLIEKPAERYGALNAISEMFKAYPPFWYHKGNAAKDAYFTFIKTQNHNAAERYKELALASFKIFDEAHVEFMREDVVAAACALDQISLLDIEADRETVVGLLEKARKMASNNYNILQMCVMFYAALKQTDEVKALLERLVDANYNPGLNGVFLSRIYYNEGDRLSYDILVDRVGEKNVMSWGESDELPPYKPEPMHYSPPTDDSEHGKDDDGKDDTLAELDKMVAKAEKTVAAAAAVAAVPAAIPIPFADAPLIVTAQVVMLAKVSADFGINIGEDGLKPLVLGALAIGGAITGGKILAANLLKLIPVKGWVIGGVISATVAGSITYAMGRAYIELCKDIKLGKLTENELRTQRGIDLFKRHFSAYKDKR